MLFQLIDYERVINIAHSIYFVLFLLLVSSCSSPPKPEIVSLDENKVATEARQIRNSVSVELADSLKLSLWASERLLEDPIGLDMTNKGEAYITVTNRSTSSEFDIRAHRNWMVESISWDEVQDRKNFLHETLSPENSAQHTWLTDHNGDGSHDWRDLTVEQEEIYRIADYSGNGIADFSQLYLRDFHQEETDVAGTVLAYQDNIYVAVAPNMWRTRDTNGDGIADKKTSISRGYAVHIGFSGHGMSGATVGPYGRVYWSIGDIGLNVKGPDGKQWVYPNQGAIMRSDPVGSNFEVYAAGVRNTHEFVFDKFGNLISVDNDGDHAGEHERVVYLINGSDSGWRASWQYGKYVDPKNNDYNVWMDEGYYKPRFENQAAHTLPPLAAYHSGPAGMAYNPGTALSDKWDDHFFVSKFVGSPSGSAIYAFDLKPQGASFKLKSDKLVLQGIAVTGMDFGPGGSLYFADWITGWDTKEKGRIWKLDTPATTHSTIREKTKQLLAKDFASKTDQQLSQLLGHTDKRVRQKAQFELVRRSAEQILREAVGQKEHRLARIHSIWGIGQLARDHPGRVEPLVKYLQDGDAEIRAQVARTIGDVRYQAAAGALVPLLEDPSLRVRLFATQALGRVKYEQAVQPIIAMLEANNDRDVYLRHAGAIALARIGDVQALAQLANHPSEAVRIAAVVALKQLEAPEVAHFLKDESEYVVTNAARAINDDAQIKEALPALARMLEQQKFINEPLLRRAINACLYSGTATDAKRLASFALRKDVSDTLRTEALATLSVWPSPSTLDRVTGRYRGEIHNNRQDAVKAVSSVIDPLLSGDNNSLKIAMAEATSALQMDSAASDLNTLLREAPPAEVKVAAFEALHHLKFPHIDQAVEYALGTGHQRLRMTALGVIPSLDISSQQKVTLLASVLNDGSIIEQQSALTALGVMQTEAANQVLGDQLSKLLAGTIPDGIMLELVQAADSSHSEKLHAMLKKYRSEKPKNDVIAQYRETLHGGNAKRGAQIFYNNNSAQCTRCHAVGGDGGSVGPDLANIGRELGRKQLLKSMIVPNNRIASGFGSVSVTLQQDKTVQGVLKGETADSLTLQTAGGKIQHVSKDQITERQHTPSAMFAMGDILSKGELRDLVEFLSQLRKTDDENTEQGHGF